MKNTLTRRTAASLLALGPALLSARTRAAEPPKDPPVFRIGALLGLTDKANWNATVMQRGIMMAVDEINAKGGIDGIKLEAAIEDHQGVPRVGVDGLERLRARYDIQAVLLSYSTVALATAPICEQNKIFMMDGGSVSEALVGKFSYLFHNRAVATVLARAALTIPKAQKFKKMAVMAASTDEGQSLLRLSKADWEAYGGSIVDVEQALATASNIDTQIAKVAGEYAEGYQVASDYFNPEATDVWPNRSATSYKAKYGDSPEVYAANYYEGIYIVAELIRRAKPSMPSVYGGNITWQPDGTCLKRVGIFTGKDGEAQFQHYAELA